MEKIKAANSKKNIYILHYKTHKGHIQIDFDTILYCYGDGEGPYTQIVIEDGTKHSVCESIGSIERLLHEDYFCRCHKSWLVNLKKVDHFNSLKKIIVLKNNFRVPISRSRWPYTLKKLITFLIQDRKHYVND